MLTTNDFINWILHMELWRACIFLGLTIFWIMLVINLCSHFLGLFIGCLHGVVFTIRYVFSKSFRDKIRGVK